MKWNDDNNNKFINFIFTSYSYFSFFKIYTELLLLDG